MKLLWYWKTESQLVVKPYFEHLEVVGHKDAIDYIEQLAQQPTAIGEWEIKQIHNLIMRAIRLKPLPRASHLLKRDVIANWM